MKKIITTLIALMIFTFPVYGKGLELIYDNEYHVYNGSIYSLYVNGERIISPMEPIIFNDRALVPVREIFEKLGAKVDYFGAAGEVTVTKSGFDIKLKINSNVAYVNGVEKNIPDGVVPKLITKVGGETKTMVPVRFISESIGLLVDFDGVNGSILITTPQENVQNVIQRPVINKKSDFETVITLNMTEKFDKTIKTAVTDSGVMYFDLSGVIYEGNSKTEVNHSGVKSVRLGLHEGYTRVAVDMVNYKDYKVVQSEDKKSITVTVTAKEAQTENTPVTPEDKNEENKAETVPETAPDNNEDKPIEIPSVGDEENSNETVEMPSKLEDFNVTLDINSLMNYTPSNGIKYVVLDAGHGGQDPGAEGNYGGKKYLEKDINLSVVKLVKAKLEQMGISVILTRAEDTYPTLYERPALANKNDGAIFVSIHVNSATTTKANGIEIYYSEKNNRNYYDVTSKNVADAVIKKMIEKTGARNRGVKKENHVVTRESIMPAILVELGFISNSEEIQKLINAEYQNKLAEGIAEGIAEELGAVNVPERAILAEKLVAEQIGAEKAKEYMNLLKNQQ